MEDVSAIAEDLGEAGCQYLALDASTRLDRSFLSPQIGFALGATTRPFSVMVGAVSSRSATLLIAILPLDIDIVLPWASSITSAPLLPEEGVASMKLIR